ncbi:T9SS type A sorting domain-containing protein [Winogradskyella sp.]|uniref:T9SS type A sorting domain-containing protein n=1 Tax=Winogradskyella sp. TaxID=1883156 RepID=UPI00260A750B|nr:T9SS type A sorting domain-containing protein [Winogradskyella sp.]
MKSYKYILVLAVLWTNVICGQDITLTFDNAEITNDGMDDFYEADILISSGTDFYLGSGQLYIDYSTAAFGENISTNGNIEYGRPVGSIIGYEFPGFPFPTPAYKDFVQNDNTTSRVSLSFQQNVALAGLEFVPEIEVISTPRVLMHIKIRYVDVNASPDICFFSDGVFQDQFFTACGGTNIADCTNNPGTQITDDSYDCSGASLGSAYTYNNGWSPSDPNGVSTSSDVIEVIAGTATISTSTDCNNITVRAGAGITVNSGVTLSTASGMVLESTSTSYSSLILDGNIAGTVTYERHVNQTAVSGGNDLITPPVSGQSFTDFLGNNTNIVSNTGNTLYLFGPFDKTSNTYVTYSDTESAILTSGVGYRAATTDNSTLRFEGTVNQGTVSQGVFNTGPNFSEWNLIGNPYPSYLNVWDFLNNGNNMGVLDVANIGIYGYDGDASDGWTIYNLNTTDVNTVVAPGQGFFVAVNSDASIEFTPGMRRHGNSDDFIAGRNTATNLNLRLQLSNTDGDTSSTDFYFNDSSTNGLDPGYDAAVFGNSAFPFALYSRLLEDNEGIDFAIQSLPLDILSNGDLIPLGINANQGEQLTISIGSSNLGSDIAVYLLDTQENQSTDLNTGDFVITPQEALDGTGRFYISLVQGTLGASDNGFDALRVYTLNTERKLVISGTIARQTSAVLYDINGRAILSKSLRTTSGYTALDTAGLQSGVYILRLWNGTGHYTEKVIID